MPSYEGNYFKHIADRLSSFVILIHIFNLCIDLYSPPSPLPIQM